jgi:N-methylhydantoinase A
MQTQAATPTRIGVDVGGTFTDLIVHDGVTGEVRVGKQRTSAGTPEDGVLAGLTALVDEATLSACDHFLHATTVGLNALLQRRGACVGLLSTRGFRDVLEIRRGDRVDTYNPLWRPPPPLVPRDLRIPVRERVAADGTVHAPLDPADVEAAIDAFTRGGVTAVAIAFINAYANPEHELQAERLLRELGFAGPISVSHRASGEYREYERTSTTVIDAFVRGEMTSYLGRLERRLRHDGFRGTALITRSGGGAMTFAEAEERPFETIMSGPVAGAEGAAILARELRLDTVITADVGGTSFDTCLIVGGQSPLMFESSITGLPVQAPWVDIRSIGAGGGSIATVDRGGLLSVGPTSAGADPGPACYGRGGSEPTVTDAALHLGMLGHGVVAGGLQLDCARAAEAMASLTAPLALDNAAVGRGIITIAASHMADAISEITIERGYDPRRATLVVFGGAGPLFGTALAKALDITRIVVPQHAGNFSAWGLLGADLTRSAARTHITPLGPAGLDRVDQILAELFEELRRRQSTDVQAEALLHEAVLDVRYIGQEHTLSVAPPLKGDALDIDANALGVSFEREYARTFGDTMDEQMEVVNIRATIRGVLTRHPRSAVAAPREKPSFDSVEAYSFTRKAQTEFVVVDRSSLAEGQPTNGPAIIVEPTATTFLDCGFEAALDPSGSLLIRDLEAVA